LENEVLKATGNQPVKVVANPEDKKAIKSSIREEHLKYLDYFEHVNGLGKQMEPIQEEMKDNQFIIN
tara:strand:- start:708 stop:908 length:201 start_codon:yes stop_codon:yes gene_type:complete